MKTTLEQITKDAKLIRDFGGSTKLAKALGYEGEGGISRVHNWIKRGIPPAVKIEFPQIFLKNIKK